MRREALTSKRLVPEEISFTLQEMPRYIAFLEEHPDIDTFLWRSYIQPEEPLIAMCDYLKTNKTIKNLSFVNYKLTQAGFEALKSMLETNQTLHQVIFHKGLESTFGTREQQSQIKSIFAHKPSMRPVEELDFSTKSYYEASSLLLFTATVERSEAPVSAVHTASAEEAPRPS